MDVDIIIRTGAPSPRRSSRPTEGHHERKMVHLTLQKGVSGKKGDQVIGRPL